MIAARSEEISSMLVFQWGVATAITTFAALIAFFQWRTAQVRVVIDLFDRRHAIYHDLQVAVASIVTSGQVSPDAEKTIGLAIDSSRFFFGAEVVAYVEKLFNSALDLQTFNSELKACNDVSERATLSEKRRKAFDAVEAFYKDASGLFGPYMKLDQKMKRFWHR